MRHKVLGMNVPDELAELTNSHEGTIRRFIRQMVGPHHRVLEAGSGYGVVAMACVKRGAKVVTIDPDIRLPLEMAQRNRATTKMFPMAGKVVASHMEDLRSDPPLMSLSTAITLAEGPLEGKPDFLIMDIEGDEWEILERDSDVLRSFPNVILELHDLSYQQTRISYSLGNPMVQELMGHYTDQQVFNWILALSRQE